MPFIGDEELLSFQNQIEKLNQENQEIVLELNEAQEALDKEKSKGLKTNIFFGILSGLAIGVAGYLLTLNGANFTGNSVSDADLASLRAEVRESVLDSITNSSEDEEMDDSDDFDAENASEDVSDGINNQRVFSVQVKALSQNKFPVMSSAIAGFATVDEYFKYSIGVFNNLEEAQDLRKELVKLGFRDAFVASYVNGKRKEIHVPE